MASTSPDNISYPTNASSKKTIEAHIQDTATSVQAAITDVRGDVDTLLAGKANSSHSHSGADITSGTLSYDRLPSGTVIQVVQTVYASHATISSGVDTAFINFSGLDTTVVPRRANSKFLIRYQINIGAYSSSIRAVLKINGAYYNTIYTDGYRASTNSIFGGGGLPYSATINAFTGEYLFTNSASNNVSIGFEIMKQDPNYNAYINRSYGYTDPQRGYPTSTVTILEVAG